MIASFGDATTEDLYHGRRSGRTRQFGPDVIRAAARRFAMLHVARRLEDLRIPPGNRLEALQGDRAGQYSIRVNGQFRIVFRWHDDAAHDVSLVDYHSG